MQLINQHTKKIMEQCKDRAREAGLSFDKDTLEYIVTNRDMISLSPKVMIPTLYDYWVNDVEILKEQGKYKLSPSNPYETVINSRPAISFYNDNNPDWMNIMIFYHVIAHIDFFQNNRLFERTWGDDFVGQALADKRLITRLRSEHGRWVDYAIEFSRCINNLVGYFDELSRQGFSNELNPPEMLDYYFGDFLQKVIKAPEGEVYREVEKYNQYFAQDENLGESWFFNDVRKKYPEFQSKYKLYLKKQIEKPSTDVMEYIRDNSPFLNKEKNEWIKLVMSIVRNTSLYFEPQIRTKIINEGWASYWHDELFRRDERIKGHEVAYARLNAAVTSVSRSGLNPYAIGLRLVQYVEELANKGKIDYIFQRNQNIEYRENYDLNTLKGKDAIFALRKHFSDFTLINTFSDQEFVDQHDLFVLGQRVNQQKGVYEYYVKSRKGEDYKKMLIESLYHPPHITVDEELTQDEHLYLVHHFEGKPLLQDFIYDTMLGIEFLWGGAAKLETTEIQYSEYDEEDYDEVRVLYTLKDRKLSKEEL
jgi:stage V sporulation protein R